MLGLDLDFRHINLIRFRFPEGDDAVRVIPLWRLIHRHPEHIRAGSLLVGPPHEGLFAADTIFNLRTEVGWYKEAAFLANTLVAEGARRGAHLRLVSQ